jgi:acyl carrier protein
MNSKEEILTKIIEILSDLFEVEASDINAESNLYEDLDIDSIDAIDLVVKLKEITGKKVQPEEFKSVRTVNDVVEIVYNLLQD